MRATAIILSIMDVVVGANIRKKDFSCDYQSSIGLKSGEYGDKQIILAPTDSMIDLIDANLWGVNYPSLIPLLPIIEDIKNAE